MKLRKNKKGFTIVELVIVIAVIGVLAAVLIPTFINLNNKANKAADESLVKNLNTALATQEQMLGDKPNDTMNDAVEDLKSYGYLLPNLVTKSEDKLLWNSKTNRFLLENNINSEANKDKKVDFWRIQDNLNEQLYSVYAGVGFADTTVENLKVGFDAGDKADISSISYVGGTSAQDVVIRTNSANTNLTINSPKDVVKHFGTAGYINIKKVAGSSYHENGIVSFLEIANGRIALEQQAEVEQLHLTATDGSFDNITIAKDAEADMPAFSRDAVTIPSEGKLVVALQSGTGDPTAEKKYVWLTAIGIYEQVTLGTEEAAGTIYASESGDEDQKYTAQQIANNITFSAEEQNYKVVATKSGDTWTYSVATEEGEATTYTATLSGSEIVVKDNENRVVETKKENGLSEEDKEKAQEEKIEKSLDDELLSKGYALRVGINGYNTVHEAVQAAPANSTIKLLKDHDMEEIEPGYGYGATKDPSGNLRNNMIYFRNNNVTFDLGGHTISNLFNNTFSPAADNITFRNGELKLGYLYQTSTEGVYKLGSYVMMTDGANNLTIESLSAFGGINISGGSATISDLSFTGLEFYAVCAQNGATVTINGGSYNKAYDGSANNMFWIEKNADSSMIINGGRFDKISSVKFYNTGGDKPIVRGGTFNFDPSTCVDTGYGAHDNGDGTWTVLAVNE